MLKFLGAMIVGMSLFTTPVYAENDATNHEDECNSEFVVPSDDYVFQFSGSECQAGVVRE